MFVLRGGDVSDMSNLLVIVFCVQALSGRRYDNRRRQHGCLLATSGLAMLICGRCAYSRRARALRELNDAVGMGVLPICGRCAYRRRARVIRIPDDAVIVEQIMYTASVQLTSGVPEREFGCLSAHGDIVCTFRHRDDRVREFWGCTLR